MQIKDYYTKYVEPLDARFRRYSFETSKTVVCPLHNDHDPSMGVLPAKGSKPERYHCFGCGKWGDVVDLHMKVMARYKGVHLGRGQAAQELGLGESMAGGSESTVHDPEASLIDHSKGFNVRDFERAVRECQGLSPQARARLLQDAWMRAYKRLES